MSRAAVKCILACASVGAWLAPPAAAQEAAPEPSPVNKQQIEAALKLTTAEADKYAFILDDAQKSQAQRAGEPLLKWSNPAAGEIHGNVFLWTVNERPAAIGSLFKWFSPYTHMSHEFHSLSEMAVTGSYSGKDVWRTHGPGLKFAALAGAPQPAASAPQRLLQIRRLARDFTATKTERDGKTQELRLLTQPLYRYAAADAGIADGALFVLVQGTDPEVFLLIEARGTGDAPQYHFAATRMNGVGFQLRYRDSEVWSAEIMPWSDIRSHAEVYTTFMFQDAPAP